MLWYELVGEFHTQNRVTIYILFLQFYTIIINIIYFLFNTIQSYKTVSSFINIRLYNWAEDNNTNCKAHSGFRRNYYTVDYLFSFQAIIQKYLSKHGGHFYCLDISFRKAFDKINHNELFSCLKHLGIYGYSLKGLNAMHSDISSCIKADTGLAKFLKCNIGTRQGDTSITTICSCF